MAARNQPKTPLQPGPELLAVLGAEQEKHLRQVLSSSSSSSLGLLSPSRKELLLVLVQQLINSDKLVRQQVG